MSSFSTKRRQGRPSRLSDDDIRRFDDIERLLERTYDAPAEFPYRYFYPIPLRAFSYNEAEWLVFLDKLFFEMGENGVVVLNVDEVVDRGQMREKTWRAYIKRAEQMGLIRSPYQELVEQINHTFGESWWRTEGKDAKTTVDAEGSIDLLKKLFNESTRTRTFIVPTEVIAPDPDAVFYKPRQYVSRGWSDMRWHLAERQAINALCLEWSQLGLHDGVQMTRSQIRAKSQLLQKENNAPSGLKQALERHMQDGALTKLRAHGHIFYRLDYRNLLREAPVQAKHRDILALEVLRADVAGTLGLDATSEEIWIDLLSRIIRKDLLRMSSLPSFYNVLINNHPYLCTAKELEKLYDWMCSQGKVRRSTKAWRPLLTTYIQSISSASPIQPVSIRLRELRFCSRTADGEEVRWSFDWQKVVSSVLICDVGHGRQDTFEWPYPRLALQRDGQIQPLEHAVNWNRKYQRIELDRQLKDLSAEEPLAVMAALPCRSDYIKLKYLELRLGVYGKKMR